MDYYLTYDFFANETDKIEVLNFIFRETDLQIFASGSTYGQKINEYRTTGEIVSQIDLHNGDKFAVTFQLWTPRLKGDLVLKKGS